MMSSTEALFFFRKPWSAWVGLPPASYAAFRGGPFTSWTRSASRSTRSARKKMMRRGVVVTVAFPPNGASFSRMVFCAASCIHAGISSVSSSKKYSAIRDLQEGKSESFAQLEVLLRAADGKISHALDDGDALGDGDRAARVE